MQLFVVALTSALHRSVSDFNTTAIRTTVRVYTNRVHTAVAKKGGKGPLILAVCDM